MDNSYLECDLPEPLNEILENWKKTQKLIEEGNRPTTWDLDYEELNSEINSCYADDIISERQAWYLKEKYLGIKKEDLNGIN